MLESLNLHIRWLIRRDMLEVLNIEQSCFEYYWTEEDFLSVLRLRNCIGMVATHVDSRSETIVGFMLYELHKAYLRILNFAVHPDWQRRGVGMAMADRLKDKLSQQRRKRIKLETRESNLRAHLFWKSQGFECIDVLRQHYDDTDEDAYLFQFTLEVPVAESAGLVH